MKIKLSGLYPRLCVLPHKVPVQQWRAFSRVEGALTCQVECACHVLVIDRVLVRMKEDSFTTPLFPSATRGRASVHGGSAQFEATFFHTDKDPNNGSHV